MTFTQAVAKALSEVKPAWRPLPHQVPPDFDSGDWLYWVLSGGRGTGKTDAGAHAFNAYMVRHAGTRGRIIAPTLGDAREACVIGPSGIRAHNPDVKFNQQEGALQWPNGSRAKIFGAYTPEDVERLRAGGNSGIDWYEELAAWAKLDEAFNQARFGLRIGQRPRTIVTTTPKPRKRFLWLIGREQRDMPVCPATVLSHGTTDQNPHLSQSVRNELYAAYANTRLGEQELKGNVLEDVPGALWSGAMLEAYRVQELPDIVRVVVGVDPSVSSGEASDETGIVVAALGVDGRGYIVADRSIRLGFDKAAIHVVGAFREMQGDRIVAEKNNGGDMVSFTLRTIDPNLPITLVHASRGKRTRAEPIAALYEQGKVSHCGIFPALEDQMCTFTPDQTDRADDRVDSCVYALTELMLGGTLTAGMPTLAAVSRSY